MASIELGPRGVELRLDPAIVEGDQDVIAGQRLDRVPGGDVVAHTGHEHDGRSRPA